MIRAVGVTPANVPEASVTEAISADLKLQHVMLKELHIDRAYWSSHLVRERNDNLEVYCKAWPVRSGKYFHKQAFTAGLWIGRRSAVRLSKKCPFSLAGWFTFLKRRAPSVRVLAQCTTSAKGRSVSIHAS